MANLLFLTGVRAYSGESAPMIAEAEAFEPEVVALVTALAPACLYSPTLHEALDANWSRLDAAARQRRARRVR